MTSQKKTRAGAESTALEIGLYDALRAIAKEYDTPDRIRRISEKEYGLSYEEALEMAYENIQALAARAIYGVRIKRPAARAALKTQGEEA
ncbi:MAG: hypothetical protein KJZ75_11460 [Hyphomonadaceae bacterium]|nr:hypothetical protein [Hyphomonadaceae bacterium]